MLTNNVTEAIKALTEKPVKSTSFQRVEIFASLKDAYRSLSQPERFGKIMFDFLSRVDVPIKANDVIAGRYTDKELTEEEELFFQNFIHDPSNVYRTAVFETGHCTLDWEDLINSGLTGLKKRAEESLEKQTQEDKKAFLRGAILFYDALINFISRYAESAENSGKTELASVLRSLTQSAPQSFRAAVQLLWIVAFIDCAYITENPTLSLGRLDRYLYPLYKKDIESGEITRDDAKEILTDYYCKHNLIMGRGEHQLGDEATTTGFSRILNFDAPQYLAIAGTDEYGKPAVNELTLLMAECIEPRFKNPVFVVRYYEGMADDYPELWSVICKKALQSSSLMIYNDNDVISAFSAMGVDIADARNYEHFGCNWAGLGKDSCWMLSPPYSSHFCPEMTEDEREKLEVHYMRTNSSGGWVEDFTKAFKTVTQEKESFDIDDLYSAFFKRVREFVRIKLDRIRLELIVRNRHPSKILTFGDCFRIQPVLTATANNASAAKYHFEIQSFMCFASVVDCFTAVDVLVLRDKKITAETLLKALEANFVGYDDVLAMCRNAEKFGSDGDLSNRHAERLANEYLKILRDESKPYAEKYGIILMPSIQSDTHNIKMGECFGASADGRLSGQPFSQNSRPQFGSCSKGLTGMLGSLLHLPFRGFASGSLNLDVQPAMFAGEKGEKLFENILKTYFDNGGLHVQVSCQDVNELIDAQIHPENHRDLTVRVTGYSGIFVDMTKAVQDYVIARMKN